MANLNPTRAELLKMFALDTPIVRATGFRLFDEENREYLDFLSQYGALPFGHNPPDVWAGLNAARSEELPSLVQPLRAVEAERLAERLAEITPGDLAITTFTNSGAETVEAAIKLARVRTGRQGILSTTNGFHGKTLGALSATGKPLYQKGFAAPSPGFDYIPYGDLDALEARLECAADGIAAFIVEPIQGEGGVICPPEDYIDAATALCRAHGVLIILDEIQTGLGRTGQLFSCSNGREVPDMLLLAKALGGGLMPIGACIVRPSAWDDRFGRLHSSTFANNNIACRAANATLDLLLADDGALVRKVAENGAYLKDRLLELQRTYPEVIREVRGRGYMTGLDFHRFDERSDSALMAFSSLNGGITPLISSYLMNVQGLLTAPLFNETHVLRLQPPLTAGRTEIDRAVAALDAVCAIIASRNYYALVRHLVARPIEVSQEVAPVPEQKPVPDAVTAEPGRFGFLIHYTEEEDIFRSDPSFRQFSDEELVNWCNWVKQFGPGFARRVPTITSKTGATAEGYILSVPMLPHDMRGRGRSTAAAMITDAVDTAVQGGVSRLGLGAFTSIVTRGGEMVTGRNVPITSGNTLTTVSAIQGIENIAKRTGIDLDKAHVAVVGASGAIGRLAALMLSRRAGRLSLVGNAANPFSPRLLSRVADEVCATLLGTDLPRDRGDLYYDLQGAAQRFGLRDETDQKGYADRLATAYRSTGRKMPLEWTTDLSGVLEHADIVVVATSSETTLVDPSRLKAGTLVCDVARPPNVAKEEIASRGVLVFDGGLVRPPSPVDLGVFQTLPTNLCWGCLGETMLLALARQEGDFSIGSKLPLEDADLIATLAERHGFAPAEPQWYGRSWTDLEIERFSRTVRMVKRSESMSDLAARVFPPRSKF